MKRLLGVAVCLLGLGLLAGHAADQVLIPKGTNSGIDPDFDYYSLTVDSFYMDATEVTKAQWDEGLFLGNSA